MIERITNSLDMSLSKLWETVKDREDWCAVVHGVTESNMTEPLNNNNRKLTAYNMEYPVSHLIAPEAQELTWIGGRLGIINNTESRPVDEIT